MSLCPLPSSSFYDVIYRGDICLYWVLCSAWPGCLPTHATLQVDSRPAACNPMSVPCLQSAGCLCCQPGIWHKEGAPLELNKQQGNIWGCQEPIPWNFTDSLTPRPQSWRCLTSRKSDILSRRFCHGSQRNLLPRLRGGPQSIVLSYRAEWSCCSRHPHIVLSCRSERNYQII